MNDDELLMALTAEVQEESNARFSALYGPFSDDPGIDAWIDSLPTWGDFA